MREEFVFDKITNRQWVRTHQCVRWLSTDIKNTIDIVFYIYYSINESIWAKVYTILPW